MNLKDGEVIKLVKNAIGRCVYSRKERLSCCICGVVIVMLQEVVDAIVAEYMPIEQKGQKKPKNQQETKGYSSWFYWRRTSEPKKVSANLSTSDVSSPESEKLSNVKEVHMWLIMIHWKVRSHLEKKFSALKQMLYSAAGLC